MTNNDSYLIGVIYCPRGFNGIVSELLSNTFAALTATKQGCFIMGEYNCNLMDPCEATACRFLNLVYSNTFLPLHNLPTRVTSTSVTLLDMVLTNVSNKPCTPGILIDDVSDHLPVFIISDIRLPNQTSPPKISVGRRKISPLKLQNFHLSLRAE